MRFYDIVPKLKFTVSFLCQNDQAIATNPKVMVDNSTKILIYYLLENQEITKKACNNTIRVLFFLNGKGKSEFLEKARLINRIYNTTQ